jgi:hypothetical protein
VKHLILLAARGGSRPLLDEAVVAEARRYAAIASATVTAMRQVDGDPFGSAVPGMRVFDATIEVVSHDDAAVLEHLAGLDARLEPLVHADLSGVLAGRDHAVIPCDPTSVRYQYVMRRKIGTSSAQYLDHYVNRHAAFGRITPGIEGYIQFHVDSAASERAARAAGTGVWRADSVSELHLASVQTFLEALAISNPGPEAGEDEERFVDRPNSVMFTSEVLWRC